VAKRPNYGQERAERQRRKAARRDERLAAKAERRDKGRPPGEDDGEGEEQPAGPAAAAPAMPADAAAMHRLGQALAFVCGPEHAATLAVRRAVESGAADDVARARAMFLQLGPRDQRAALAIAAAAAPSLA
jgi:hypothetical protein